MFNAIEHCKDNNIDITKDIKNEIKILSEKLFNIYYYNGFPLQAITLLIKEDLDYIIGENLYEKF